MVVCIQRSHGAGARAAAASHGPRARSVAVFPVRISGVVLGGAPPSFVVPAHGSTASGYGGTQRDVQGSDGPDASGTFHDIDK